MQEALVPAMHAAGPLHEARLDHVVDEVHEGQRLRVRPQAGLRIDTLQEQLRVREVAPQYGGQRLRRPRGAAGAGAAR